MPSFLHLYQLCMILNCLLNSLWLNADVPLRSGCGTVLKEPLHQRYVKAVCVVDFRCVPLAEAMGTDTLAPRQSQTWWQTSKHAKTLLTGWIGIGPIRRSVFTCSQSAHLSPAPFLPVTPVVFTRTPSMRQAGTLRGFIIFQSGQPARTALEQLPLISPSQKRALTLNQQF